MMRTVEGGVGLESGRPRNERKDLPDCGWGDILGCKNFNGYLCRVVLLVIGYLPELLLAGKICEGGDLF